MANVALGLGSIPKDTCRSYRELGRESGEPGSRHSGQHRQRTIRRILHAHQAGPRCCRSSPTCTIAGRRCAWRPSIRPGRRDTPEQVETLSCVDRYQFAWHLVYLYDDDEQPLLPAGTILHVIGMAQQHAGNKFNPDPDNLVPTGSGPSTT